MPRCPRRATSYALVIAGAVLDVFGRLAREAAARLIARAVCYASGRDPDASLRGRCRP